MLGGASSEEKSLESRESGLGLSLKSNYDTAFAHDQDALKRLNAEVSRIQSGDTGPGFGAAEEAARVGQINANAGAEARNVQQAVANAGAGSTFGDTGSGITSGIRKQLNEEAVSGAERDKANALLKNTAENYGQGRVNAAQTAGGLEALSGGYQREAGTALSGAENANAEAAKQAHQIQQEESSGGLIGGLLTKGLSMGASFLTGGISNLGAGESAGEGAKDFLSGGFGAIG
jgi:hypothetical protein